MEIKRNVYLEKLVRRKHNGLVKVLTGGWKCGKSYLLFRLFYQYLLDNGVQEDHIIQVDLDDPRYKDLRSPEKLFPYVEDRLNRYILCPRSRKLDFLAIHHNNCQKRIISQSSHFKTAGSIISFLPVVFQYPKRCKSHL